MICIIFLASTTLAIISPAEYLYQLDRPKVAAHRGLCSIFPENTIPSFHTAMYLGTDFIELDVVMNRDHELIVAHDTFMSTVSTVVDMEEYVDRMKVRTLNGNPMENWWILDFTTEELSKIGIKQIRGTMRATMYDGLYKYPTLKQVLQLVSEFNTKTKGQRNPNKSLVGILLEIKDYGFHTQYTGKDIVELIVSELREFGVGTILESQTKVPIVLMSFDQNAVKKAQTLTDLPRVQLVSKLQSQPANYIQDVGKYANVLGVDVDSLWDSKLQQPKAEVEIIRNNAMLIYGWTFQDDNTSQLKYFNVTTSQELYKKSIEELKVNGIITEFSDAAISFAQAYKK